MDFPWIWPGLGSGDGMDLVWCRFVASKLQRFGAAGLGGWHGFLMGRSWVLSWFNGGKKWW